MAGEISLTTGELAQLLGAELTGDASVRLDRVEPIDAAGTGALTFIRDAAYAHRWAGSGASAALITREACSSELLDATRAAPGRALLVVPDADRALLTILGAVVQRLRPAPAAGVHPSAVVHPSAKVDPAASIGPGCVVEAQARVGAHAVLMAQVYVGRQAAVGDRSVLHPGVKLQDQCVIGARCVVHANVSIGADGFGFVPDAGGLSHTKIPHAGNVVIDDDVEIGAGTCIDRAKFGSTRVGAGTKIDNLVQIAHGVQIGRGCLICGCSSLAGSSSLGDGSIMGGGSALSDNVKVGVKARLAGYSAVSDDVPDGASIAGVPGIDARDTLRSWAIQRELARMWPSLRRVLRQAQPESKTPRA